MIHPQTSPPNVWTFPNILTFGRIATVPLLVVLLHSSTRLSTFLSAFVFALASISDLLDGILARRRGIESVLGKFLDPLADKLLVSAALIMLIHNGSVPAWVVFVIIARELSVTGLRAVLSEKGVVLGAAEIGKYKTGFQIAAIIPLLIHYPYFGINFHGIGTALLWMALVMTVWSGASYFTKFLWVMRQSPGS